MRRILDAVRLICLALVAAGCAGSEARRSQRVVRVAAAADLKFALEEVSAEFQQLHPDTQVEAVYGASGTLFGQLVNQAPFDIFLAADVADARRLMEQGKAIPGTEFRFGFGQIVLWVPNEAPWDMESRGMDILLDPAVRKIALANPKHAPYGRAAEAAMRSWGVADRIQDRLVLGENVAQAAQFVASGAADIGIISLSLALAPSMKQRGRFWIIPANSYPKIEHGGVILKWVNDREATEHFRSFLLGCRGQDILRSYGFVFQSE